MDKTPKGGRGSKSPAITSFDQATSGELKGQLTPDGTRLSPKGKHDRLARAYLPSKFQAQTARFRKDMRKGTITVKNIDASLALASPKSVTARGGPDQQPTSSVPASSRPGQQGAVTVRELTSREIEAEPMQPAFTITRDMN